MSRVVEHLETMPPAQQRRWKELLSYIGALVYHGRRKGEHQGLQQTIENSVQAASHQQEVKAMGQTMAEYLEEKGRQKGRKEGRQLAEFRVRQKTLLRQLSKKFGDLPSETATTIKATKDIEQFDAWLDIVLTAAELADVSIH